MIKFVPKYYTIFDEYIFKIPYKITTYFCVLSLDIAT